MTAKILSLFFAALSAAAFAQEPITTLGGGEAPAGCIAPKGAHCAIGCNREKVLWDWAYAANTCAGDIHFAYLWEQAGADADGKPCSPGPRTSFINANDPKEVMPFTCSLPKGTKPAFRILKACYSDVSRLIREDGGYVCKDTTPPAKAAQAGESPAGKSGGKAAADEEFDALWAQKEEEEFNRLWAQKEEEEFNRLWAQKEEEQRIAAEQKRLAEERRIAEARRKREEAQRQREAAERRLAQAEAQRRRAAKKAKSSCDKYEAALAAGIGREVCKNQVSGWGVWGEAASNLGACDYVTDKALELADCNEAKETLRNWDRQIADIQGIVDGFEDDFGDDFDDDFAPSGGVSGFVPGKVTMGGGGSGGGSLDDIPAGTPASRGASCAALKERAEFFVAQPEPWQQGLVSHYCFIAIGTKMAIEIIEAPACAEEIAKESPSDVRLQLQELERAYQQAMANVDGVVSRDYAHWCPQKLREYGY